MTTRYFGAPITRNEDRRLLTGRALFVNDVERPGMLHVAFLRSPQAHARLGAVDLSRVRKRPGVVAAYAADDLGDYWKPGPLLVPPPPIEGTIFNQHTQVPLARGKVRHVGEPVAVVVAESRYIAEDALADIAVEYQPLPAVIDIERALAAGSVRVHDDLPARSQRASTRKRVTTTPLDKPLPWCCVAASATTAAARRRSRRAVLLPIGTPGPNG
jgi:aerobic carbon-monoxide dehydrogenase large subunit